MQNLNANIFLAVVAFTVLIPESTAKRLGSDGLVGQERQIKWQQVAPSSTFALLGQKSLLGPPSPDQLLHPSGMRLSLVSPTPEFSQGRAGNAEKETGDGALIGFNIGAVMSSGNAQGAVNQEGQREESAKQEKARKKAVAKDLTRQESASRESPTNTSGESGKEATDSGTGTSPSASPPTSGNR